MTHQHQPYDECLNANLDMLATMAGQIGAEGVWLVRGATGVELSYTPIAPEEPAEEIDPPDPNLDISTFYAERVRLSVAPAGVYVLIRFPADDRGETGIESK